MGTQYQLLTLFSDGGWMMYPLVLCSLIALGVIIAKAYTLWVAHKDSLQVMEDVEQAALSGDLDAAIHIAESTPGPSAAILLVGLRRIQSRHLRQKEFDRAVSTTGAIELGFLERGLVILATIANVAPLMGFLGTVVGMVIAFAAIERAGDVDPALVAGGIKVALLTTAAGLTVAIPVNIGYNFFVSRIDQLIVDMEQGAQRILNLAWDLEKKGMIEIERGDEDEAPQPTAAAAAAAASTAAGGSAASVEPEGVAESAPTEPDPTT